MGLRWAHVLLLATCIPLVGCELALGLEERQPYQAPAPEPPPDPCSFAVEGDYRSAVLADAPLFYWTFDELHDNLAEQRKEVWPLAGDLRGIVQEGASPALAEEGAPGSLGGAAAFHGDNVIYADTGELPLKGDTAWSMEFWIKSLSTATRPYQVVVGKYDPCGSCGRSCAPGAECQAGFMLDIHAEKPGELRFIHAVYTGSQSHWNAAPIAKVSPNGWHHIVAVYDPDVLQSLTIYRNGIQSRWQELFPAVNSNDSLFVVGDREQWAEAGTFVGLVDELSTYGYALGPEAVRRHYCAALSVQP